MQIASVYIGAVIGAGFASGQEMIQFFVKYGRKGLYGLVLTGVLYSLIGGMLLEIIYEKKWTNYESAMKDLVGKQLSVVFKWTVNAFLFVCFSAMLVGAGAVVAQQFNVPILVGACAMMVCSLITFLTGSKGFVKVNVLLVPLLCVGGVLLGGYIMLFRDTAVFHMQGMGVVVENWFVSTCVYVAYNVLTVVVILISLHDKIDNKHVAHLSALLGGLGLGALGLSIGGCTLMYYARIKTLEIPMLGILINYPAIFQYIYLVVLLVAMYTTAIANGYGVIENIAPKEKNKRYLFIVGMCVVGLLGVGLGFSKIVAYVYPLFGYIGCFEILILIVYYSYMKWEHRRN